MSNAFRSGWGILAGVCLGAVVGIVGYRALGPETPETTSTITETDPADPSPITTTPEAPPLDQPPEPLVVAETEPEPEPAAMPEPALEEPAQEESDSNQARAERIVQAQMKMLSEMVYKPYYEEAGLAPDTQTAAADLFAESFGKQQRIQQRAMMQGERTAAEIKVETDALRDELRDQLAGILNEEELAAWEEYDAYSDQVLFEALLDGQLRMLAPNLNIDSHQKAMAVMAEELALAIDSFESSSQVYSLDNFNEAQYEGLTAAMQRLQSDLDADQAAHAQGFVDEAKAMFDAMKSQAE